MEPGSTSKKDRHHPIPIHLKVPAPPLHHEKRIPLKVALLLEIIFEVLEVAAITSTPMVTKHMWIEVCVIDYTTSYIAVTVYNNEKIKNYLQKILGSPALPLI